MYENKWNKLRIRRGTSFKFQEATSVKLHESGAALASRALAYGSLWAVFGCGIFFISIWKLIGAKDLKDFRLKAGSVLPHIPKNNPPVGRTEFSGLYIYINIIAATMSDVMYYIWLNTILTYLNLVLILNLGINDFLTYIIEEDKKKHNKKEDPEQ